MVIGELSIYFENPATDALGYEHVEGKFRCGRDHAELQYKERDRAFRKPEPTVVQLDYSEIEGVEYVNRWFRPKILVVKTKSPDKLAGFPGGDVGQVELFVTRESRKDAAKAPAFVDFKQSEAYLRESDDRLDEKRHELDSGL
jgi:hypothetical protein